MTIQAPDTVVYKGESHSIWSFPLESYPEDNPRLEFDSCLSSLWRGYEATWLIEGDTLYLTEIQEARVHGAAVGLAELFPGQGEKVEASWFSGEIRIHGVREPTAPHRERDQVLTFQNGKLIRAELSDPRASR
jgi:hypothetical protein